MIPDNKAHDKLLIRTSEMGSLIACEGNIKLAEVKEFTRH